MWKELKGNNKDVAEKPEPLGRPYSSAPIMEAHGQFQPAQSCRRTQIKKAASSPLIDSEYHAMRYASRLCRVPVGDRVSRDSSILELVLLSLALTPRGQSSICQILVRQSINQRQAVSSSLNAAKAESPPGYATLSAWHTIATRARLAPGSPPGERSPYRAARRSDP